MPVPHGDIPAKYKISDKYIGITYDETQAVMIKEQQYWTCLCANGQFCKIDAPFQVPTISLTCIMALYAKNVHGIGALCSLSIFHTPPAFPPIVIMSNLWTFLSTPTMQGSAITMICPDIVRSSLLFQQPLHMLKLPPAFGATSRHFHLLPHYEDHAMTIHVSQNKLNLNAINVLTPDFCIWQHFGSNWPTAHIQKLAHIPEIPISHLYKHLIGQSEPILQFEINRDTEGST